MEVKSMDPAKTWIAKRSGDSMTINGVHAGASEGKVFVLRGIAEIRFHEGQLLAVAKNGAAFPLLGVAGAQVAA